MKDYRKRYLLLLLLSLLLHMAGYWWYLYKMPKVLSTPEQSQTVSVTLKQASKPAETPPTQPEQKPPEQAKIKEEPKPQETVEKNHAPRDNADEFASDNQDDKQATEIIAGGAPDDKISKATELTKQVIAEKQPIAEDSSDSATQDNQSAQEQADVGDFFDKAQKEKRSFVDVHSDDKGQMDSSEQLTGTTLDDIIAASIESTKHSSDGSPTASDSFEPPPALKELLIEIPSKPLEIEIPSEFLNNVGNMQLLSDISLRDAEVQQPYSEKRSKELALANKYLARMNKQVQKFWINPYKGGRMFRGIIKVELNVNGYLENVRIYRTSGHHLLDISVMDAIRAVPRFDVPDNEIITNRYYRNMSFHYSSIEAKTELMPFEIEVQDKEES